MLQKIKLVIAFTIIVLSVSCEKEPSVCCDPPPVPQHEPEEFNKKVKLNGSNIEIKDIDVRGNYLIAGKSDGNSMLAMVDINGFVVWELNTGTPGFYSDPTWARSGFLAIENKNYLKKFNEIGGLAWELSSEELKNSAGLVDVDASIEEVVVLDCKKYGVVLKSISNDPLKQWVIKVILDEKGNHINHLWSHLPGVRHVDATKYAGNDYKGDEGSGWIVGYYNPDPTSSTKGSHSQALDCEFNSLGTFKFDSSTVKTRGDYDIGIFSFYKDSYRITSYDKSGVIMNSEFTPGNGAVVRDACFYNYHTFVAAGYSKQFGNGSFNFYLEQIDGDGNQGSFKTGDVEIDQKATHIFRAYLGFKVFGEDGDGDVFMAYVHDFE